MAFNGSRHFQKNELVDYLESVGSRFGPDLNAYTSFEETVYLLQARTDSLPLLEKGLLILQDWAAGVLFDPVEIDKERGVVLSEWRTGLDADQRFRQQYFPVLYKGSRYAERLPIGQPEIIKTAGYETIRQFYRDWYRPDLMAVIAVGDFEVDWMEKEIINRFSSLENPESPRERVEYSIPKHDETRFAILTDKEAAFTRIEIKYKHDRREVVTIGDLRSSLIRSLYNSMLNARLFEFQQQSTPPFTFAYSGYGNDIGDRDLYYMYAFVGKGKALEGIRSVMALTRQALVHGFTASELERQKEELLRSAEKTFREQNNIPSSSLAGKLVYHFLDSLAIPGAEQLYQLYRFLLPQIALEEVNSVGKHWITGKNRVVVVTGPERKETPLPTEEEILALFEEIDTLSVKPYEDKFSDAPLLDTALPSVHIVSEQYIEALDITEIQLPNGVQVVLKPTDFRNDEILMSAFSPGGHSLYPDEDYPSASTAIELVRLSGLGSFSLPEFQKKLTGKTVGVGPYITELFEGIEGECRPEELEMMLQLVYLYFTQPRKDTTALQSYLTKQRSIFENILTDPYYYFAEQKEKIKYRNHPRRGLTSIEELNRISLDRAYEIYRDRFADAGDFTFFLVGNFQVDSVKPLLALYLGNLPSSGRTESWRDVKADLTDGKLDTTIVRGQAPKALVEIVFHGEFDYYNTQDRFDFSALMDLLRIKMRESMREDKGGVYGVRLSGASFPYPRAEYRITLSFNSEPEKVEELIQTALRDIRNIQLNGAEEKDLVKIRETKLQSYIKNLKENGFWLGQITTRYRYGLPLEGIQAENYERYVSALNSTSMQKAAQKYFHPEHYLRLVLMPEGSPSGKN